MIAAALLAFAIKPHNLMARTHDMFDIDAHVPHAFGDWAALPGVQAVRPSPTDSRPKSTIKRRRAPTSTRKAT